MESHASFAALSAGPTETALDRYADTPATELVLGVRALRVAGRPAAGAGTSALAERLRAELPDGLEDRPLAGDLGRARAALAVAPV
jgi:histidine ammonia-lyase